MHDQPWHVLVGYFVYSVGGGLISAALPNLVIAAVPVQQQAVSASTVNVVGGLGATIAVQVGFAILLANVLPLPTAPRSTAAPASVPPIFSRREWPPWG